VLKICNSAVGGNPKQIVVTSIIHEQAPSLGENLSQQLLASRIENHDVNILFQNPAQLNRVLIPELAGVLSGR
jgi:hypothetical protein